MYLEKNIGNTPFLEISDLVGETGCSLFAKCEFQNPSGSHKDRTFGHIIEQYEKQGLIKKGMTLVDSSTGNGGAALAWIGKQRGYKVVIVMPEGMTQERKDQITSVGGVIIETAKENFLVGTVEFAKEYVKGKDDHMFLNQASNLLNKDSWKACGKEIVKSYTDMGITPDYFVCAIGTGGTFSGIAEVLKEHFPSIQTIGIEVNKSAPLYSKRMGLNFKHAPHNMMGLGAGVLSSNTDESLIDEVRVVAGEDAWDVMKELVAKHGLGVGPTAGANLAVSRELAQSQSNVNIVTVLFDSSWKYKSRWDGVYPEYTDEKDTKVVEQAAL